MIGSQADFVDASILKMDDFDTFIVSLLLMDCPFSCKYVIYNCSTYMSKLNGTIDFLR